MIKLTLATLLLAVTAGVPDDKEIASRINDLQKKLSSSREGDRIDALKELGKISHTKSRSLIAKKLISDSVKVRLAAADAIVGQHNDYAVKALANGIKAARGDRKVIVGCIKALGDLDMCACVPVLVGVLQGDASLAKECLEAISRIGCVEAAPGLIKTLGVAEKEAKKPDKLDSISAVNNRNRAGRQPNNRNNDRDRGQTDNPNKDKVLAGLVKPVGDALRKLTGASYKGYDVWLKAGASGALSRKQAKIYWCEHARKRFDVPPGDRVKCPFEDAPDRHEDVFQKHRAQ